jgi:glycosyltransferase involved in cell wall biosynthesis
MEDLSNILELFLVTYNRRRYLQETLESILGNSSPVRKLHITILDNHSDDGTSELIDSYAKKHRNVIHIINNRNIGGNANIAKCYEMASYKYFWIICDDDAYDWSHWYEVEKSIEEDNDLIVVANYVNPQKNISQLLCQLSFVPAAIYKTENISNTVMQNIEFQVSTMFPQLALACKMVNDKKKIAILPDYIVNRMSHPESESYVRGTDDDVHPLMNNMTWAIGFIESMQMIKDEKVRYTILQNLQMEHGEKILSIKYFYLYNKQFGHGSCTNMHLYCSFIPKRKKILFLFEYYLRYIQDKNKTSFFKIKETYKKTSLGKILLSVKHKYMSYCQLLWIKKTAFFHQAAFFSSPSTKTISLATSSSCLKPLSRLQLFSA